MTAPRARERAGPPSPPDRRPPRRGGDSSPYIHATSAVGRPAGSARRGLVRFAGALVAAALLALTGALALPQSAYAQTVTTLVSNDGQTAATAVGISSQRRGQRFSTGSNPDGYSLSSVEFETATVGSFSVQVCGVVDITPTSSCTGLTAPSGSSAGRKTFAAPAGTILSAGTTYSLVTNAGGTVAVETTGSNAEDAGHVSGFRIANAYEFERDNATWATTGSGRSLKVVIKGTVVGVPTVTATAVTSSPDANSNYKTGEVIQVTVTFTEAVTVDTASGTPSLELTIGSNPRDAEYAAADSTATALVFAYPVTTNDHDQNGISIDANALELNGGAIHKEGDTSTDALLTHGALGTQSGHKVDGNLTPPSTDTAPVFTSSAAFSADENATAAGTVEASDRDTEDDVTGYAITGGADQALFSIDSTSGALAFTTAPDFEDPQDQGADNAYEVTVQATSGTGTREKTATQTIAVTVTNVDEGQSGTVTVDDTSPVVGDALTASAANVADPDGLPDPFAPAWQWYRTPAAGSETEIPGATSTAYTVVEADLGATLTAKASWTDKGGFANTLASAPTSAVAAGDGARPELSVADAQATEGSPVIFTVRLSAASAQTVTVDWATLGLPGNPYEGPYTADATDYVPGAGTLTFAPGDTVKTVSVETHGDTAHEDDEPFSLLLSNPMHAVFEGEGNVVLAPTGTILDNDDDLPVVSVDSGTVGVGEDVIFTVRISSESGKTAFVFYRVDIRGPDMEHIGGGRAGTRNFIQGVTQNDLPPLNRKPQEVGEVYTLTVTGAEDATAPEGTSGTIRVVDTADLPAVTIAADDASVTEESGEAGLTLTRTAPLTDELTVTVQLREKYYSDVLPHGMVTLQTNFDRTVEQTVTFAANAATAALEVELKDDNVAEGSADLTVTLKPGDGYTAGDPASATVTVTDESDTGAAKPLHLQAIAGPGAGEVVLFWAPPLQFYEVARHEYRFKSDSDYGDWVEIPDSGSSPDARNAANRSGYAVTDLTGGEIHTFEVRAVGTTVASAASNEAMATPRTAALKVSFGESAYSVDEGGTVEVTVRIEGGVPGRQVTVPVAATAVGGATAQGETGADWSGVPETVTFGALETAKTFTLTATDDTDADAGESVALSFGTLPPGVTKGTVSEATVTIVDDDTSALPTLSIADAEAAEGDGVKFTVTLSATSTEAVTATWTASIESGDTATAPDLATTKTGTVTIAANATTTTFTVPVANDTTDEDDQTFTVTLSGVSPSSLAELAADPTATGTIIDDDPTPTVTVAGATATEGNAVAFAVTLSAVSGRDVTVDYATSETDPRSAVAGTDFTSASGTLMILAADSTATGTIEVETTADDAAEGAETFTLTLSNPMNATLGTPSAATGTIDDPASTDTTLSSLVVNDGTSNLTLDPAFVSTTTIYEVSVAASVDEVTMTPVTNHASANFEIRDQDGDALADADAMAAGHQVAVAVGETLFLVRVTAEDDTTTQNYEVRVTRPLETLTPPADALVSNIGQGTGYGIFVKAIAQGFGTGSNASGYTLTGVDVASAGSTAFTAQVCGADTNGRPTSTCTNLTPDGAFAVGAVSFTAPPNTVLTKDTPYAVVVTASGNAHGWGLAFTDGEDAGKADGWSIRDGYAFRLHDEAPTTWSIDTVELRMAVRGSASKPRLSIADAEGAEDEGVEFTVTLSEAVADEVTATWTASIESGDTADAADLTATTTGMVTVAAGATTTTFTVPVTNDTTVEDDQTFTVTLSGVSPSSLAELAADPTATGTIKDDDTPVVTIAKDKNAVIENEGAAGFTLSRTGSTAAALTVKVGVTQQADRDLLPDGAAAERTVTFAVGSATAALSVALENDDLYEAPGILTVEVQPGTGYTVGSPGSATMAVVDSDRVLPTPANLSASVGTGPGEVVLSWDPYAANLAISWHEYRYKTDGTYGNWTEIPHSGQAIALVGGVEVGSANLTGWTVTGLVGEVEHTFEVRTTAPDNRIGTASNEAMATPRSAAVSYGAATYSVDEGATVVVRVSLSGAPGREVTVPVAAAAAGGATAQGETGADWSGVPETVTFGATSTAQTFTLTATQDMSDDDGESVVLTFGTLPPGVEAGTVTEATVTIGDDDAAPTVTVADAAASEGDSVAFVVTLSAASGKQVTVDYATSVGAGDDATSGTDFTAASGTLTIEAGEATGTIEVAALEDDAEEDDETFTLTLSNPNNATLGTDTTATGTIVDGTLPRLSVDDAEGAEDEGVEFTVTLSEAVADEVTATWTASIESGDTAVAADLTATTTTTDMVTVAAGATTAKFTVPVNNDTTDEPDQTFTVTLSNPSPASLVQLASDPTARGTIEDEDDPPTVGIVSASGHEGRDPDTLAPTLMLSAVSEKTVTVTWTASIGSGDTAAAADFVDLSAATGTVDITPGRDVTALNTIIAAQVFDDALDEQDETFTVTLSNPVNATVGKVGNADATGTMTIEDDDPTPTVTVDDAAASEGGKVAFTVTLSAVSGRDVEVGYATSVETGDTAVSGTDFTAASGTLTILAAAGTATGTVEVQTTEDDAEEDDETFTLTLSDPKNATLGTPSTATGTINDGTLPRLSVADAEATEGSPVTFAVTLSAEAEADVTATWTASIGSGDTAVLGDLGPTRTGTVEIEAGETDATIAVATVQDDTVEVNETFTVTLSGVSANAELGTATATGTIDNDDLVMLSVADVSAAEGDAAGEGLTFTVRMTEAAPEDVTVDWTASIGSGDSASADDLTGDKTGTMTIDKDETTGMFTVATADTTDEPRQTFTVTLSNPTPASLAQLAADPTAEGRIEDDDDPPTVDVADAAATEGDNLEFAVTLSAESEMTVTVRLTTLHEAEDTAEKADLGAPFVTDLTFDPGDTEETAVVGTVDDALDEDAETFTMEVYELTNVSAGDTEATGTINDNDDPPTVTVADGAASEGDDVAFVVTLSAESGRDVEVDYATSVGTGQTATSGTDFTAASGTLTIDAGDETGTIAVETKTDRTEEDAETFTLTISDPKNATLTTDTTATGTINNRTLPALSVAAAAAAEGDEVEFTVTLSAADAADVTFTWTASLATDDTAVADDFTDLPAATGTLTIAAGGETAKFTVPTAEDSADEADETFTVTLSGVSANAELATDATAKGTIEDNDDPPAVSFGAASYAVDEGGSVEVTVVLTAPSGRPEVVVPLSHAAQGGATAQGANGADYAGVPESVTFAAGATERTFTIEAPADAHAETGEGVALSFATLPDGAAPGSVTRSAVSLNDVAVTVSFEQASYTAAEGGPAVAVVLTLEPAVSHTLAVTMTARNGEGATAADYQGIQDGGRAIFTPGQTRSSFDVTAADDALDEADETVTLGFTFATSDTGLTKGSVPEATLRLTDDDDPPGLEDVMDASASEGDEVEFAVTLTEASGRTVNLGWEVRVDGVPASAADFDPFPQEGVLTFAPGVRTGTIAVATAEDANDEEDETFELRITGDGNVDLPGGLTVTGTIEDDDGPPTLSVADAMATEGIPVSFTVTLTPPSGKQVTVNYATSVETGDNATSDTDFTAASSTLTFRPGQTTKTVRVETVRDGVEEGNETFTLTLSDATNATLPDPPTARGTIEDEIAPPPVALEAEPVEGSYTSLVVSWTAPDTDGGPALTGYGLRHRERPDGDWVEVSHAGTVTTATLTGLEVNTVYEVEVRALYGEMQSVWVRVAGQVRTATPPPAGIRNVRLVGGPGSDDGVWSTGERVEVEVHYDKPVVVEQSDCWTYNADGSCRPSGPYMLVAFSSNERPGYGGTLSTPLAPYEGGSGTNVLTFAYTVGAAEDGALRVEVGNNGMFLRGATIRTLEGGDGASIYTNTRVRQVDLEKPAGRAWTAGDTVRVAVRFAGPVQYTPPDEPQNLDEVFVDDTGGTPTIGLLLGDHEHRRVSRTASYERGSGSDTLTFEYEVRAGDGRVSAVEVVADSLARSGATIRNEEGYDAELHHVSVLWYSPLALRVRDAAAREGGTLEFAMELARASPGPVTVDYETADGTATAGRDYTAKRGTVTFAPGRMRGTVQVPVLRDGEAEDAETVVLRLSNARAGGSRAPVEVTVAQAEGTIEDVAPEAPSGALTARFAGAPAEHDGKAFTLRIAFSEAIRMSGRRLRGDVVAVTGGRATKAGPVNGRKDLWELTVKPDPRADVTVTLAGGAACDAPAAVCTADGKALSHTISATVRGPVTVSVADARVREAAGATLDFAVSLSRAASGTVAVAYATADGSARAGSDYTARKGQLRFAPGETEKTVAVPVLDDAHDEGEETMRLRLLAASGAAIADGEATGTIENTDHMPAAWLARFGRTVTDQVLDAVEARLAASRAVGTRVRLAGQALPFWDGGGKTAADDNAGAGAGAGAWRGDGDRPGGRERSRALTRRDFVTGTSFELTGGSPEAGGSAALWGRGAISRFDGREGDLTLDGEVTTGLVGADWASAPGSGAGRWTAGLAVGHARGTGSYTEGGGCTRGDGDDGGGDDNDPGASGCAGEVESTLTGLWPYAGLKLTDRLSISAAAGYGAGELTLTPKSEMDGPFTADLTMAMGAAGLRGEVLVPPPEGGLALAVKGDTRFTRTRSKATRDAGGGRLEAATGDVWLLRLGVEGSRRFALGADGAGATLTPRFEVGARLDGGDAETGLGADLGAGVTLAAPRHGLMLVLNARGLLAHEASGLRESGASASLAWDPRPATDRGLALTLRQGWGGSPAGGMNALLGRETLAGLAADDNGDTPGAGRLEAELGYGIPALGGALTATPHLGIGLSDTARDYRLGWRLKSARKGAAGFELGLDATRREAAGDDAEHGLAARLSIRW